MDPNNFTVKEMLGIVHRDLKDSISEVHDRLDVLNGRTRKLENWRNLAMGVVALVVFATPIALRVL